MPGRTVTRSTMDPSSVTAGIAMLLSLAIQVAEDLNEYSSSVKHTAEESKDLYVQITSLRSVLEQLEHFLEQQSEVTAKFTNTSVLYSTAINCHTKLNSLNTILSESLRSTEVKSKLWRRCVLWPLKK